jgi:NTE family protein
MDRAKIGLVVGSGGIKTLAAVELFSFLRREQLDIDLLVGCSGGAILASLFACGYSSEEICENIRKFWNRKLFERLDWRTLAGILKLPFGRFEKHRALLDPRLMKKALDGFFGDRRLEDLSPRLLIQTTDIATGEGVVLDRGRLSQVLYASAAQFPFLPPEQIDGKWLVDGAFSSALPIMEAVRQHVDVIIALVPNAKAGKDTSFIDYCLHFFSRSFRVSERTRTALAVDLHHHEIIIVYVDFDEVINMWNVEKIPVILEAGKKAMERSRDEILAAVASFKKRT